MKTFLKVIGKLLAIVLGIVLFVFEITYSMIGPITGTVADLINNPEKVIEEIDINELIEESDNEEIAVAYDQIVNGLADALEVGTDQAKEIVNSEPVKQAIGQIMGSVMKVALGDESAKMTNDEITDIVFEAATEVVEDLDGYYLPEDTKEYIGEMIDEIGIDDLYEQLAQALQPTNYNIENVRLLSNEDGILVTSGTSNIYADALNIYASKTIDKAFIMIIVVLVLLIFLCQFSIFGGLLETGIVTVLSSIASFGLYACKEIVVAAFNEAGLPIDISIVLNFDTYLTNGIIMVCVGVALIIVAIVYKTIKNKQKQAKQDQEIIENSVENDETQENLN